MARGIQRGKGAYLGKKRGINGVLNRKVGVFKEITEGCFKWVN